jgi:hypothetical protein
MMTARPETAADYITATADLIRETAARTDEAILLVQEAMANPALKWLRRALTLKAAALYESAAALRAKEPSVAMFAAVEHARQDQCRTCPLLRAQVVTLAPRQRARALSSS